MPEQWPNDPDDDGNALHGAFWAAVFAGGLVLAIVALVALFRWLL